MIRQIYTAISAPFYLTHSESCARLVVRIASPNFFTCDMSDLQELPFAAAGGVFVVLFGDLVFEMSFEIDF